MASFSSSREAWMGSVSSPRVASCSASGRSCSLLRDQVREAAPEVARRLVALRVVLRVLGVTGAAQAVRGSGDHRVGRLGDLVLPVTLLALRPVVLLERLLVLAPVEERAVLGMAGPADLRDRGHRGRHRRVVAMAAVAGRSAQVALLEERLAVHRLLELLHLVGGQGGAVVLLVARHVLRVRMAVAAGVRNGLRVHLGLTALGAADAVHAVTAHALRRLGVLLLQAGGCRAGCRGTWRAGRWGGKG